MATLGCAALTLALLLAAGNSSAAVDPNRLAGIVEETLNRFRPSYRSHTGAMRFPMFSLAVSVPFNTLRNQYDLSRVPDDGETVREAMRNCEVYSSRRVVAATALRWPNVVDQCPGGPVQWPDVLRKCHLSRTTTWAGLQRQCPDGVKEGRADHAEYRTLQHFSSLLTNLDSSDLLLFYVLASPCDQRCSNRQNPWNILESIKGIKKWKNYALVFSDVFQPRSGHVIPEQDLRGALERLGQSIGLGNIFRCRGRPTMTCTRCWSNNTITRLCFSDHNLKTCQSTPFITLRHNKSDSCSQN